MTVSIAPHVGTDTRTGEQVRHDVDLVLVDGREVGYLSMHPAGRPNVILTADLSESELALVIEHCRRQRAAPVKVVNPPPDIPAEFLEQDEDDEDGDDQ